MSNNDLTFLEIRDFNGKILLKDGDENCLPKDFLSAPIENLSVGRLKQAFRQNENGSVRLIFNKDNELFQGSRSIQRACFIYLSLIPKVKQIELSQRQSFEAIMRRFAHNLSKFQSRFKDSFFRLVPDGFRGKPFEDLKKEVKSRIESDIDAASYDVCQMSHRATDLDAQIETLRIISGFTDNTGSFLPVNIAKAIFRLTNPFIDELKKKHIRLVNNIPIVVSDKEKIPIVHELFNVAMWQIFDNACKYALKNTDITITADLINQQKKLIIEMVSISIDPDEEEAIFIENIRGKNVKDSDGTGIGMYIAKKALKFMKANIYARNNGHLCEIEGIKYSRNVFTIEFSK